MFHLPKRAERDIARMKRCQHIVFRRVKKRKTLRRCAFRIGGAVAGVVVVARNVYGYFLRCHQSVLILARVVAHIVRHFLSFLSVSRSRLSFLINKMSIPRSAVRAWFYVEKNDLFVKTELQLQDSEFWILVSRQLVSRMALFNSADSAFFNSRHFEHGTIWFKLEPNYCMEALEIWSRMIAEGDRYAADLCPWTFDLSSSSMWLCESTAEAENTCEMVHLESVVFEDTEPEVAQLPEMAKVVPLPVWEAPSLEDQHLEALAEQRDSDIHHLMQSLDILRAQNEQLAIQTDHQQRELQQILSSDQVSLTLVTAAQVRLFCARVFESRLFTEVEHFYSCGSNSKTDLIVPLDWSTQVPLVELYSFLARARFYQKIVFYDQVRKEKTMTVPVRPGLRDDIKQVAELMRRDAAIKQVIGCVKRLQDCQVENSDAVRAVSVQLLEAAYSLIIVMRRVKPEGDKHLQVLRALRQIVSVTKEQQVFASSLVVTVAVALLEWYERLLRKIANISEDTDVNVLIARKKGRPAKGQEPVSQLAKRKRQSEPQVTADPQTAPPPAKRVAVAQQTAVVSEFNHPESPCEASENYSLEFFTSFHTEVDPITAETTLYAAYSALEGQ